MSCDVISLWPSVIEISEPDREEVAHVLCPSARGASILRDISVFARPILRAYIFV